MKWNTPSNSEDVKNFKDVFKKAAKEEGYKNFKLVALEYDFYLASPNEHFCFYPIDGDKITVELYFPFQNVFEEVLIDNSDLTSLTFDSFKEACDYAEKCIDKYIKKVNNDANKLKKEISRRK